MKTNLEILSLSSLIDLNIPKSLLKQLLSACDNPYFKTHDINIDTYIVLFFLF